MAGGGDPGAGGGGDRKISGLAQALRKAAPYLNLGWSFVVPMIVGLLIGRWLDRRFSLDPWATLGGLLLGMGAGFLALYRVVLTLPKGKGGGR